MNNCLLDNPIKVKFLSQTGEHLHTYVFVGDVPSAISKALNAGNFTNSTTIGLLKSYYGVGWKSALDIPKQGGDDEETPDDKIDVIEEISTNDDEDEIADIDIRELTSTAAPVVVADVHVDIGYTVPHDGAVEYIMDTHVFPEDNVSELRDKIFAVSGVPAYRQHLFWNAYSHTSVPYKIYANGVYPTDIIQSFKSMENTIAGCPIDKILYSLRDERRIETLEPFTLVSLLPARTFFVIDLDSIVRSSRIQINALLEDSYKFDLFYHGFVVKFWPQMSPEVFSEYISDESSIFNKYPRLAKDPKTLAAMHRNESKIITHNYKTAAAIQKLISSDSMFVSITNAIMTNINPNCVINVRNLFDKMRVSRCNPQIHAYVEHDGVQYMLKKTHERNRSDIAFPAIFRKGLIMAISLRKRDQDTFHAKLSATTPENEQAKYMFLNIQPNGKYYIKVAWNDEDELNFERNFSVVKKFIDPIIEYINGLSRAVFVRGEGLTPMTKHNIDYKTLGMSIFWKKTISSSSFAQIRNVAREYVRAGIIAARGMQHSGAYEFSFIKGMYEYDTSLIDKTMSVVGADLFRNRYAHAIDAVFAQRWDRLYGGRPARIIHRTTDVKFEISGVRVREFEIFYNYIAALILDIEGQIKKIGPMRIASTGNIKKLKKLREADPELYNLKKHGSDKVYSILCQNPRQPNIYTEDEIAAMSASARKRLIKYWNFTFNKPAHYDCTSAKYPHLSFIVGVHPKKLCLPCCGKLPSTAESKKMQAHNVCLSKYTYETIESADDDQSRHVMNYGKDIDVGRVSRLPPSATKGLFYGSLADTSDDYFIFGVPQHFPSAKNVGALYCVAAALELDVKNVIDALMEPITDRMFPVLFGGKLAETFESRNEFVSHVYSIFVDERKLPFEHVNKFTDWNNLFIELTLILYRAYVFVFADDDGTGDNTELLLPQIVESEMINDSSKDSVSANNNLYILVLSRRNKFYPIFVANENASKIPVIRTTTFERNAEIISSIYSMVLTSDSTRNRLINASIIKEFVNTTREYKISRKYISKRNFIYAMIIENNAGAQIHVPVDFSPNIADKITGIFTAFDRTKYKINTADTLGFIAKLNKYISAHASDVYSLVLPERRLIVGDKIVGIQSNGGLRFYVSDSSVALEKFPEEILQYDPDKINAAIISSAKPCIDNRKKLVGVGLYNNYLYQLFLLEFVNFVNKERNTKIRKRILAELGALSKNEGIAATQHSIEQILKDYPADFEQIKRQISNSFTHRFIEDKFSQIFSSTVYEFDRETIREIRSASREDALKKLRDTAANFIVVGELDELDFPNIYLPCEYLDSVGFCKKKSLIVPKARIGELVELLLDDLLNPLVGKYISDGLFSENVVEFLRFEDVESEKITVMKVD